MNKNSSILKHLLMFTMIIVGFNAVTTDGECIKQRKVANESKSSDNSSQQQRPNNNNSNMIRNNNNIPNSNIIRNNNNIPNNNIIRNNNALPSNIPNPERPKYNIGNSQELMFEGEKNINKINNNLNLSKNFTFGDGNSENKINFNTGTFKKNYKEETLEDIINKLKANNKSLNQTIEEFSEEYGETLTGIGDFIKHADYNVEINDNKDLYYKMCETFEAFLKYQKNIIKTLEVYNSDKNKTNKNSSNDNLYIGKINVNLYNYFTNIKNMITQFNKIIKNSNEKMNEEKEHITEHERQIDKNKRLIQKEEYNIRDNESKIITLKKKINESKINEEKKEHNDEIEYIRTNVIPLLNYNIEKYNDDINENKKAINTAEAIIASFEELNNILSDTYFKIGDQYSKFCKNIRDISKNLIKGIEVEKYLKYIGLQKESPESFRFDGEKNNKDVKEPQKASAFTLEKVVSNIKTETINDKIDKDSDSKKLDFTFNALKDFQKYKEEQVEQNKHNEEDIINDDNYD